MARRNEVTSAHNKLEALILALLAALLLEADRYRRGAFSVYGFPVSVLPILAQYHTKAAVLGRQEGGVAGPETAHDRQFGQAQASLDAPYLEHWADQLADGWGRENEESETGSSGSNGATSGGSGSSGAAASQGIAVEAPMKPDVFRNRLRLYANRLRPTALEAFVQASPAGTKWLWVLDRNVENCPDCVRLSHEGPWVEEAIPTYPGAGDTVCLTQCKCHLLRLSDRAAPFAAK